MNPHYALTEAALSHKMSEPPPDAVRSVIEILGISTPAATNLLKRNNNDVARCMEAYFADPDGSVKEDKSQPLKWEPQDNVPFDDASSTGVMAGLSRPPSRADNTGISHGRGEIQDLSGSHAEATALANQAAATNHQQQDDDDDMRRAIEMSLRGDNAQPSMGAQPPPQEYGVTTVGSGQQFGPANRQKNYNPSEWGMVPLGPVTSTREFIEHPSPSKRRRLNGQPAFLRPTSDTNYLAALLTIYHSIPLAREALLLPSLRVTDYGYDPQWWTGTTDENTKHLTIASENADGRYRDNNKVKLLAEVQCLMAILDGTKRAYASVDALADLHILHSFQRTASTPFSAFLEAWRDAALSQQPPPPPPPQPPHQEQQQQQSEEDHSPSSSSSLSPPPPPAAAAAPTPTADPSIFVSEAKKALTPTSPEVAKEMVCVEPSVLPRPGQTLVNLLDSTVWDDTADSLDDVWISHAGEVFTIRLFDSQQAPGSALGSGGGTTGLQLTAPAVWYPDRYMTHLREATRAMRAQCQDVHRQIQGITSQQRRLESFMGPGRKPIRAREVLEAAAAASKSILNDRYAAHTASEDLLGAVNGNGVSEIETQIRGVLARVDRKIGELEEEKSVLQRQIDEMNLRYTEPVEGEGEPQPRMRYLLQGVATRPEVMYVRRRQREVGSQQEEEGEVDLLEPEESDMDTTGAQENDDDGEEWKWWRIAWTNSSSSKANNNARAQHAPMIGPISQAQAMAAEQHRDQVNTTDTDANTDGSPYTIAEVSEASVIEAARTEHHSVVLIYASEAAVNYQSSSSSTNLSPALRKFVEQDNKSFERELRDEEAGRNPSNLMANGNKDEVSSIDSGFASQQEDNLMLNASDDERPQTGTTAATVKVNTDREFTPMSWRGEDGQPSPKRPKSSDNDMAGGGWGVSEHHENLIDTSASPPPYEEAVGGGDGYVGGFDGEGERRHAMPEMQEKGSGRNLAGYHHHQSKIGHHAEALMEKYGGDGNLERSDVRMQDRNPLGGYADALQERYGDVGRTQTHPSRGGLEREEERPTVHIERSDSLPR